MFFNELDNFSPISFPASLADEPISLKNPTLALTAVPKAPPINLAKLPNTAIVPSTRSLKISNSLYIVMNILDSTVTAVITIPTGPVIVLRAIFNAPHEPVNSFNGLLTIQPNTPPKSLNDTLATLDRFPSFFNPNPPLAILETTPIPIESWCKAPANRLIVRNTGPATIVIPAIAAIITLVLSDASSSFLSNGVNFFISSVK